MATSTENGLPFDEKKEEDVMVLGKACSVRMSVSKQRAKAAGSAGLSELSKQLRILQAKNESQAIDINRLERQLRILAELQGISVADLRKALEDACANEAFGELQHRVAKLRAELEAASLAKRAEFAKDAAAPHIANLELRVGELEEIEEKHETEIHHLYEQLRFERERATRLEAERDQHKKDAEEYLDKLNKERARAMRLESTFQEQIQKNMEEQAKKMQELALQAAKAKKDADGATTLASVSPELAAEYERMVKALTEKDREIRRLKAQLEIEQEKLNKQLREEQEKIRQAHMDTKVDQDKMALTIKQFEDTESQNELRLAQYKARFAVQDERIQDMGQQLNSLYTAFELLKEEMEAEDRKQAALKSNLDEADAEIARQMHNMEKKKNQRGGLGADRDMDDAPMSPRSKGAIDRVPRVITTPSTVDTYSTAGGYPSANARALETPVGAYSTRDFSPSSPGAPRSARGVSSSRGFDSHNSPSGTPYSVRDFTSSRSFANTPSTPTTWQLLFPENRATTRSYIGNQSPNHSGMLMSGMLIVKSKTSMVRKWKTKMSKLYLKGDHHQFDVGDTKSYALEFGISKVEFYPNHPLSFVVHVNPYDATAPVIYAAGTCEEDYNAWMQALTKATSGGEYQIGNPEPRTSSVEAAPASPRGRSESFRLSSAESQFSGSQQSRTSNAEEQEAADLQRALELSRQIV